MYVGALYQWIESKNPYGGSYWRSNFKSFIFCGDHITLNSDVVQIYYLYAHCSKQYCLNSIRGKKCSSCTLNWNTWRRICLLYEVSNAENIPVKSNKEWLLKKIFLIRSFFEGGGSPEMRCGCLGESVIFFLQNYEPLSRLKTSSTILHLCQNLKGNRCNQNKLGLNQFLVNSSIFLDDFKFISSKY